MIGMSAMAAVMGADSADGSDMMPVEVAWIMRVDRLHRRYEERSAIKGERWSKRNQGIWVSQSRNDRAVH